jgi:hypothetical protein
VFDVKDGGYFSRKFTFGVGATLLIVFVALVAAKWVPAMIPMYDAMVGGIIALYGLFLGGNISGKHVIGKANVAAKKAVESPEEEG